MGSSENIFNKGLRLCKSCTEALHRYAGCSIQADNVEAALKSVRGHPEDLDAWIQLLSVNPDGVFEFARVKTKRDIFTARELLALYSTECKGRLPAVNTMSARLKRKLKLAAWGKKLRIGGQVCKAFIVRNEAKWLNTTMKEIHAHMEKTTK